MTYEIDENFAYFLKKFGDPFSSTPISETVINNYRDRLPEQLFRYWAKTGASGFAKGLLWMVNPKEYQPILDSWIAGTEFEARTGLSVIARSAFGELFVWERRKGKVLVIDPLSGAIFHHLEDDNNNLNDEDEDEKMQYFWAFMRLEALDYLDEQEHPLFERAFGKLGKLTRSQMYGFAHAPCLGGKMNIENLDIVQLSVYHDISRQMNGADIVQI